MSEWLMVESLWLRAFNLKITLCLWLIFLFFHRHKGHEYDNQKLIYRIIICENLGYNMCEFVDNNIFHIRF